VYYTHRCIMKIRMQITIKNEIKEKMDLAKDFYGSYSGLIEKAVEEFLSQPVEPYEEDKKDAETARKSNEWTSLEDLKAKLKKV
jgi:hypothetical protein